MQVILRIPADIPEKTLNELAKRAAEALVNDERNLVPVVRCMDCVFYNSGGRCALERRIVNRKHIHEMRGDDFCSLAERRDDA